MGAPVALVLVTQARFARYGLLALEPKAWGMLLDESPAERGFTEEGDAAVVTIRGPLIQRAEGFLRYFCDSYDEIEGRIAAACVSAQKRVILRIDSPGGDAPGCLELAREIRAMLIASGKPSTAFVEGGCGASAAYAIACAAAEVVTTPTCYVGSIGVYEVLQDHTAAAAAYGVNIVVVSSGKAKLDRNPDVPISDEAIARVQAQVDEFAALFCQLVADMRGGTPDQYRALDGAVFLGVSAIGAGLADRVSAWGDLIAGAAGSETSMGTSKKSFDAAKEALRAVVDDEKCSSEERDKARKSLRALEEEDKPKDDDKKDGGEGKAAGDEEQKKKDEEMKARAAAAASSEAAAQANAQNALALAREVQELKAKDAARDAAEAKAKEDSRRAALFAQRPDFSEAQRATLALVPVAEVEKAVKDWPRVNAQPGAAASAIVAGGSVTGGEPTRGTYVPRLTASEQAMLDKLDAKPVRETRASVQGTHFVLPTTMTQAEAAARVAELEKENG